MKGAIRWLFYANKEEVDSKFREQINWEKAKVRSMWLLLSLIPISFAYEIVFCGLFESFPVFFGAIHESLLRDGECARFLNKDYLSAATTFSYSLSAFLLVAVAVVFSGQQRVKSSNKDGSESGGGGGSSDDSGGEDYSFFFDLPNPFYEREAEDSGTENEIEQIQIFRVFGQLQGTSGGSDSPNGNGDDDGGEDNGDDERRNFNRRLQRALAYSISASLLGVLITTLLPLPVLFVHDLPRVVSGPVSLISNVGYAFLTHVFTFIFLGMVWTSVELIELLDTSSDTDK
ncbi:hypothetical protein [Halococcus hamelinensis]|uniref:hypothetical protein n=2 Tax=Halococcus hamelinensis TaxID=332168 RepID=UPI001267470A|nr:hypothetical protein [Halococcus hamelinensis]